MRIAPRYYRPTEVDYLLADADQAERHLGWKPKVSFHELVRIRVDADLENLGIAGSGEGMRLLPTRFNGWHR